MRFWKPRAKRLAAMVCALALTASLLPTAVFATEPEPTPTPEPTPVVETTSTPEPSESPVNTDATVTTPAPDTGTGSTSAPEATPAGNTDDIKEPVESPEPSEEPTDDTTESGEEGTETTDSTTVPSEEPVESPEPSEVPAEQEQPAPQMLAAAPAPAANEPETRSGPATTNSSVKNDYITLYYVKAVIEPNETTLAVNVQAEDGTPLGEALTIDDVIYSSRTMRVSINDDRYAGYEIADVKVSGSGDIKELPGSLNDGKNRTFTYSADRGSKDAVLTVTLRESHDESIITLRDKKGNVFGTIDYDDSEYPPEQAEQNTTVYVYLNDDYVMTVEDLQIPNTEAGTGTKNFVLALHDGYWFDPITEGLATTVLDHSTIIGQTVTWHKDVLDYRYSYLTFGNIDKKGDNFIVLHFYGNSPEEPAPDDPTDPELSKIVHVVLDCTSPLNHDVVTYDIISGSWNHGQMDKQDDGSYLTTVRIYSEKYVGEYNKNEAAKDLTHTAAQESGTVQLRWTVADGWQAATEKDKTLTFALDCKPADPTVDDVTTALEGMAVTVDCVNAEAGHESKTYGLLGTAEAGDFAIGAVNGTDADKGYTVTVTIKNPDLYVKKYNTDVRSESGHVLTAGAAKEQDLTLTYDGEKNAWIYTSGAPAVYTVKCENVLPEGPKPEEVIELLGTVGDVTVTCDDHGAKSFPAEEATLTYGLVDKDQNGLPVLDITVRADAYVQHYCDNFGEHVLDDEDVETVRLMYNDGNWTFANKNFAGVSFKVKCVAPDAPGFDTVKGLLGDVKLVCGVHDVPETYALTEERVVIDDVVGGGYGATVKVTVLGNGYLSDYNAQNAATIGEHAFAGSQTLTVELVYGQNGWSVAANDRDTAANLTFNIKCVAPDAPTDDDIADALAAMQVQVKCGSEMKHGAGTYALKPATYGEPQLFAGDDTWHYTLQIMVEADAYLIDYNNDTALSRGYTHTLGNVKAQMVEITFTYDPANKAWNNDAETVSPVVFPVSCHATTPGGEDEPSGGDDGNNDNNNNNNNNNNNTNNNQNKSTASASASASATVTAPAAPAAPAAAVIPQTGDEMPVGLLAGLALVAAGGLAALLVLRKRRSDR